MKCKACGHLSECDPRHKMCSYIVKNPPSKDKSKQKKEKQMRRAEKEREQEGAELDAAEEKRKKKEKRLKKQREQGEGGNNASANEKEKKKSKDDDAKGDEVVWATDTSSAAAKARAEEQLTGNAADMVNVSKELKTQLSLTEEKNEKEEDKDEDESESESEEEDERITKLRSYAAKVNDVDLTLEFLDNKLGIGSDELKVYFLMEAILDDEKPVPFQLKKKKAYIEKFVGEDEKKQRGLLNALELYATDTNTDTYKIYAAVLNALYELDLCEEKCIREWFEEVRSAKKFGVDEKIAKAVRKQAASFIEYLDEDSDDEEYSDEDDSD